jgi:hypothetical protein
MKSPVLLCSAATLLVLSACATAPSSERSVTLRRGKLIVTEAAPAPAAPAVVETPAPVAPVAPAAPVEAVTPALTVPEPLVPVVVAPTPVPPPPPVVETPPPAPVVAEPGMVATRSGGLVQLSWTLPASESGFRAIEIMRNTQEQASGRSRVRAVRATVTTLEDVVPDAAANYWYWLKLTHADGTIENLGPYSVPAKS